MIWRTKYTTRKTVFWYKFGLNNYNYNANCTLKNGIISEQKEKKNCGGEITRNYVTWKAIRFFYLVCEAIGTAATSGLLCQPQVIVKMIVEKKMECRLAGETKVLGENLPQRQFCPSQNSIWPDPGLNTGRRGGKPATNHLSNGAAKP
jgi:hypothetical protein